MKLGRFFGIVLVIFLFGCTSASYLGSNKFEEDFVERAKSLVYVKFILEYEEGRENFRAIGIILDNGYIMLPPYAIPNYADDKMLRDFKAYTNYGDHDGYELEYVGVDNIFGYYFLKFKKGKPVFLNSFNKFKKGKVNIGDSVWGIDISQDSTFYEPFLLSSRVSLKSMRAFETYFTQEGVSVIGSTVFNDGGELVGYAISPMVEGKLLVFGDGKRYNVNVVDELWSNNFISAKDLDRLSIRIPRNKNGDDFSWLGMYGVQVLPKDVSKLFGMEDNSILAISDVMKNSPAYKAGIRKGDKVIALNGEKIKRYYPESEALYDLLLKLGAIEVGSKVTLTLLDEKGKTRDIEMVTEKNPKELRQADYEYFKRLGFTVREFVSGDAINRRIFDIPSDGAVIRFVKKNSPASSALPSSLKSGDWIKKINGKKINGYKEAIEMLSKIEKDESIKELVLIVEEYSETKVCRIKLD